MPDLIAPRVNKGFITFWTGTIATIPRGWTVCDGNNGTPNLLDRFVRCVPNDTTDPGTLGGSNTHAIVEAEMPDHTHSFSEGNHNHTLSIRRGSQNSGDAPPAQSSLNGSGTGGIQSTGETTDATLNNTGSDTAHDNKPSNFEVAYIMKVSSL